MFQLIAFLGMLIVAIDTVLYKFFSGIISVFTSWELFFKLLGLIALWVLDVFVFVPMSLEVEGTYKILLGLIHFYIIFPLIPIYICKQG
jgi:hypothetical protein